MSGDQGATGAICSVGPEVSPCFLLPIHWTRNRHLEQIQAPQPLHCLSYESHPQSYRYHYLVVRSRLEMTDRAWKVLVTSVSVAAEQVAVRQPR
jgi:hypothetical protein